MTENELMVAKDEMLRKIADWLGQDTPPCNSYCSADEVVKFCGKKYCSDDLCSPAVCWYKVLKKVVTEE
nr:MAG TPA: hypothetical protein [Caudoviricetes sp.]